MGPRRSTRDTRDHIVHLYGAAMITGISDLAGSRILCIDPDPKTRKFVSEHLPSRGLSVRLAEDGVEGLRAALGLPRPELIIMEFTLPNMASTEVIQRL